MSHDDPRGVPSRLRAGVCVNPTSCKRVMVFPGSSSVALKNLQEFMVMTSRAEAVRHSRMQFRGCDQQSGLGTWKQTHFRFRFRGRELHALDHQKRLINTTMSQNVSGLEPVTAVERDAERINWLEVISGTTKLHTCFRGGVSHSCRGLQLKGKHVFLSSPEYFGCPTGH